MTTETRQMWQELGINLEQHDVLLNALLPIYQEIYLSQENRPQGMGFYDFVVGELRTPIATRSSSTSTPPQSDTWSGSSPSSLSTPRRRNSSAISRTVVVSGSPRRRPKRCGCTTFQATPSARRFPTVSTTWHAMKPG